MYNDAPNMILKYAASISLSLVMTTGAIYLSFNLIKPIIDYFKRR